MAPLEEELDRLYQVPLRDFVRARNDLASDLKRSGDRAAAERVKEISKPSASAWAVNQLYWRHRPSFEKLLEAGDRYRAAQREALSGGGPQDLAAAEADRRGTIDEALARVREILVEHRQTAAPPVLDRVATTLEALASYGSDNPTPMRGRLSEDLESPGFGALASLAAAMAVPSPEKTAGEELARARERLSEEERALAEAVERERLRERELDGLRSRLAEARQDLESAETEAGRARAERTDLERTVEEAKLRVEELESERRW